MGMGNRNAANGSMIAGMGGFGCMYYNATGAATKYEPEAENRHIVAVQALTDTTYRYFRSKIWKINSYKNDRSDTTRGCNVDVRMRLRKQNSGCIQTSGQWKNKQLWVYGRGGPFARLYSKQPTA